MKPLLLENAGTLANISKPPMLIDEVLPVGSITCVVGPTYSGKTFFGLEAACSVAFGMPFMGKWPSTMGNVLFVEQDSPKYDTGRALYGMLRTQIDALRATEDGEHHLEALQIAWHQQLNLGKSEDVERIITTANKLWTPFGWNGDEELGMKGCSLIVLDTFKRIHTAQENDATEMQIILDRLDYMRERTGAAIMFLHHATKPRPDMPATVRGSTVIEGSVDNIFRITKRKRERYHKVEVEKARAIQPPDFKYEIVTEDHGTHVTKSVRYVEGEENGEHNAASHGTAPSGPANLLAFLTATPTASKADAVEWGKLNGISRATIYRWYKEIPRA